MARETSVGVAMPPRAPPIIFHIPSLPYARPRSTPVAGTCLSRSRARRARPWRQPVTARTADENRGSCGRRFPQALSRLNPAPDADHYSLMWSVTIPLAVLTPCSRSTLTHRRASVPTRFEGLPRDGPSRQRCLSAPHSHEDLDASVPQRPLAGFPIVSSDMMRPEAQGLARGAGDRSLSNPPTEETPSIPRNVRPPASASARRTPRSTATFRRASVRTVRGCVPVRIKGAKTVSADVRKSAATK